MKNIETEPALSEIPEGAKPLQDALADFKEIENNPEFRLQEGKTVKEYFEKHLDEPEITLVIPLSETKDLTRIASELRQVIFSYLKEYIGTAFAHLDEKQRDSAEADIEIELGEIIANLRHSKETGKLHNLYIKVKKVGDIILSVKLINPTPENPQNFATSHGKEYWHGSNIVTGIQSDPDSKVKIISRQSPVLDGDKNVGCESDVVLGPKDRVSEEEIESYI